MHADIHHSLLSRKYGLYHRSWRAVSGHAWRVVTCFWRCLAGAAVLCYEPLRAMSGKTCYVFHCWVRLKPFVCSATQPPYWIFKKNLARIRLCARLPASSVLSLLWWFRRSFPNLYSDAQAFFSSCCGARFCCEPPGMMPLSVPSFWCWQGFLFFQPRILPTIVLSVQTFSIKFIEALACLNAIVGARFTHFLTVCLQHVSVLYTRYFLSWSI